MIKRNEPLIMVVVIFVFVLWMLSFFIVPAVWKDDPVYHRAEILSGTYYGDTRHMNTSLMLLPGAKGQLNIIPIVSSSGEAAHAEMVVRLDTGEVIAFDTENLNDLYDYAIGDEVIVKYVASKPWDIYGKWSIE